jgi:hypothetical protein
MLADFVRFYCENRAKSSRRRAHEMPAACLIRVQCADAALCHIG